MQRIYGSSSGLLSIGHEHKAAAQPQLAALPSPSAPTPRRRRTIVCNNLTVEGETWDLDQARDKMKDTLKGDKADLRCKKRPGVRIAADWALDVCLSSWCRNCPFLGN